MPRAEEEHQEVVEEQARASHDERQVDAEQQGLPSVASRGELRCEVFVNAFKSRCESTELICDGLVLLGEVLVLLMHDGHHVADVLNLTILVNKPELEILDIFVVASQCLL